jgi:hypothetical protein
MNAATRHAWLLSMRWLAIWTGALTLVLVVGSGQGVIADAPPCTTTTTTTFSVQICLTQPAPGSTVSGAVTVTATASPPTGGLRVVRMQFLVDGVYALTDYQSPYTFVLPTARWVDGLHSLSVAAIMSDPAATQTSSASESLTFSNGVTVVPPNNNPPTITSGTTPAPGANLVVAAVGDGAGGDASSTSVANMIQTWVPNLVLYLGDVYEKGSYPEFTNWYDPTFGPFRSITNPVVGNHEYGTIPKAAGYFYYWNNEPNYYSFDAGGWHFIALNSTSQYQSQPGKWAEQLAWLQNDLAAHAGACMVAYWHHPLYNEGPEGTSPRVQDFWTLLANARATLVLNGHDHDYQRTQSLDANGIPSSAGLTEIIAGTGGHAVQYMLQPDSRVVAAKFGAFGALQLQLSASAAQFQFYTVNATKSTLFDSGSIPCRGYGTLAGTVMDSVTGKPVAGATVSYAGATTLTNSSGAYSLLKAPLGTYDLTTSASGYSDQTQSVTVKPAATTTRGFNVAPLAGSVSGTVTDSGTGSPLAGATVSYPGGQVTTDSAGAFSLASVTEGAYDVTAAASGHASQTVNVVVGPGQASTQNFSLVAVGAGTVSGQVVDAVTASPVAGATVSYTGGRTTTDSGGLYILTNLPDGNTTVTASRTGYTSQSGVVGITAGSPTQQDFALAPMPGSISGVITDSANGRVVAGATVTFSGGTTTSDPSGVYSFTGVTEASYTVSASATGYNSGSQSVSVGPGGNATANFALLPLPGTVSGTVVDVTSTPISPAIVSYPGGSATTDSSGRYSFASVQEGTYTFTVSAAGYSPQAQTVTVGPGGAVSLNVSLVRRLFGDGFESGSMSAWTSNTGLIVQSTSTHAGANAAEASSTGLATYARFNFGSAYSNLYARTYFSVRSLPSSTVSVIGLRTSTSASIARLYIDSQGRLGLRNDVAGTSTTGPLVPTGNQWHSIELHLIINGASSTIEVWLDGNLVPTLTTQSANLTGSGLIGQVQLGENQTGRSYDIALDDVVVQTAHIGT